MKKILLMLILITTAGCMNTSTAATPVEDYLSSYNNLEYEVLLDMEEVVESESDLNSEQKDIYRDILKKQYADLKYEVINENYDGNEAKVTVSISVYDYYKANKTSADYLNDNPKEFFDEDGKYDVSKYMDYKLDNLKNVTDKISYNIEFNVILENDVWKLNTITNIDLEKIHGIYNYEE